MNIKTAAIVLGTMLLMAGFAGAAVTTTEIDKIRNKGVLDGDDLQIIDKFVDDAVKELIKTRDFTSAAGNRMAILTRRSSNMDSAKGQYEEQFYESARKYISQGLEKSSEITPPDRRTGVIINLLILVDSLENMGLSSLSLGMLESENIVVRYWAVHSLANPYMIKQLNSPGDENSKLAVTLVEKFKAMAAGCDHEALGLIVGFAGGVSTPESEDLLMQIADMRIGQYMDWTVENELVDSAVMRLLCNKMSSSNLGSSAIARRFAQLYSCAVQRYIKGREVLSAAQKHNLVSVMVDGEEFIGKLLGAPQSIVKKALERDDLTILLQEHNRLLGDETKAGQLGSKLNYDYGKDKDGNQRISPLVLPEPSKH